MKRLLLFVICIFILIFLCPSCNSPASKSVSVSDSTEASETYTIDSIHGHDTDKIKMFDLEKPEEKRSAVLGYSFFKNMRQNETRFIYAFVSILNPISKIIDTLQEINASNIPERQSDTATIFTRNIILYKSLNIQLLNAADSDFIIKPFSESDQVIDGVDGNSWSWAVTPRTDKKHGTLTMNVVAEKPDGSHETFSAVQIPITISIDKAIDRSLWQWMMDNPEKVITIILIPFIVFFWKQITGIFKKKTHSSN